MVGVGGDFSSTSGFDNIADRCTLSLLVNGLTVFLPEGGIS